MKTYTEVMRDIANMSLVPFKLIKDAWRTHHVYGSSAAPVFNPIGPYIDMAVKVCTPLIAVVGIATIGVGILAGIAYSLFEAGRQLTNACSTSRMLEQLPPERQPEQITISSPATESPLINQTTRLSSIPEGSEVESDDEEQPLLRA